MLSALLDLEAVTATNLMDYLYGFFHRDFVANDTYLNSSVYINPQSQRKEDGKEQAFWHLTSKNEKYQKKVGRRYFFVKERVPDFRRSERIEWVTDYYKL